MLFDYDYCVENLSVTAILNENIQMLLSFDFWHQIHAIISQVQYKSVI